MEDEPAGLFIKKTPGVFLGPFKLPTLRMDDSLFYFMISLNHDPFGPLLLLVHQRFIFLSIFFGRALRALCFY